MKHALTCFIFSICLSLSLTAQDKFNIDHVIQSKVFGKERKISVTLPDRYFGRDSLATFTTTYILDCQYKPLGDMARMNVRYLSDSYNVLPMIAVGIHSDNRGAEFDPPAIQLQEHIEKEVIPFIEKTYRVNDFRTLMGHSWAGEFIGSTLFGGKSHLFNGYVAISPVFGAKDYVVIQQADSIFKTKPTLQKFLYCSTGDVGYREAEFAVGVAKMDSLVKLYNNNTFGFASTIFEGRGHWSCVIPSISEGLILMSRNYWADVKIMEDFANNGKGSVRKQVAAFEKAQKVKFGFAHASESNYIRHVAQDFSEQNKYKFIRRIINMNSRNPSALTADQKIFFLQYITNFIEAGN